MIAYVKRHHVKTIQASDGKHVRYMAPKSRHDALVSEGHVTSTQGVTWICLPYFSLEPYSGLLAPGTSKSFPTPTLLQAKFSTTTENRDMQQVVCQQKGVPQGFCFHVAQLWCLVLDNCNTLWTSPSIASHANSISALLLTYGRMTEETLCDGIINKVIQPVKSPSGSAPTKTLSIRYRGDTIWSIPIQECQTWFVCCHVHHTVKASAC
jgi:hypothetical protein